MAVLLMTTRKKSAGFTYFGILMTIVLIGASLAAAGSAWSMQKRRAGEAELIHVGQSIRRGIASYYNATPTGANQYPKSLEDLLSDKRGTGIVRHLRRIYRDPMSNSLDWELINLPDGSIIGVASRAAGEPIKTRNFGPWEAFFEDASCYCDWQFVYLPQLVQNSSVTP